MADDNPPITPSSGDRTARTIQRPGNINLTPEQQQQILSQIAATYPNARIVGNTAISKPQMGTGPGGVSQMIDVGEYELTIQDAQGNNATVKLNKNKDADGNETLVASGLPKEPPKNTVVTPSEASSLVKYVKGYGYYYPNNVNDLVNGGWTLIVPDGVPNPDEEVKKAVDRQVAEGDRNARQRNLEQNGIYADDATTQRILNDAKTNGLRADELEEKKREYDKEFGEKQRQYDKDRAAKDKTEAQSILQSKAQTDLIGKQAAGQEATTAATRSTTDINEKKLPGELAQQGATLEGTQASTAATKQSTQIAAQPTVSGDLTGPYITTRNPLTGVVDQSQMNRAYTPKTQAEIAARVGQINDLMQRKSAEVQAKVAADNGQGKYTNDQALKEFNDWYAQNVQPQLGSLQAAQDDAAFKRGQDMAATRTQAMTSALAAGNQAQSALKDYVAMNPMSPTQSAANQRVMSSIFSHGSPNAADLQAANTYRSQTPMDAAHQGTMEALKYIDPTAAAATGAPPPNLNQINIPDALAPSKYMPGAQMGTVAPPAPTGAVVAPGQGQTNVGVQQDLGAQQGAAAQAAGVTGPTTTQLNSAGYADTPEGRAQMAAGQPPTGAGALGSAAGGTPPGMWNTYFQKIFGGAAGQPATGDVVGSGTSTPWNNPWGAPMFGQYRYGG